MNQLGYTANIMARHASTGGLKVSIAFLKIMIPNQNIHENSKEVWEKQQVHYRLVCSSEVARATGKLLRSGFFCQAAKKINLSINYPYFLLYYMKL